MEDRKKGIGNILYTVLIIALMFITFLVGHMLLGEDFTSFFKWWAVLFLIGMVFLPMSGKVFQGFHDNGYLFSKTIGIALTGYLVWLLSSLRILKFTSASCVIVLIILLAVNAVIIVRTKNRKVTFEPDTVKSILSEELLFLIFFLIWTYIRGFKPEAHGTEKFMDYGFMASMMRSDYMPPSDMWFAGGTINYYYVGQFLATFLTKLSFVRANEGYNLMLMTLAAFGFMLPFSIAYNMTLHYFKDKQIKGRNRARLAGILSGAGVSLAGNMHFVLFYWVVPGIRSFFGITGDFKDYWFPNSTRYIGYNPDTNDKTIHEYPSYSFILGDLHAHVLNIMFVLTVTAVLFAWLLKRRSLKQEDKAGNNNRNSKENYQAILKEVINPHTLLIGFFIGIFHTTNFWDYPIYFVVAGAVILFYNLDYHNFKLKALWITALQGAAIIILSKITALPFTLNFDQISTEISLAETHTPFYQLLILWGLPAALIIGLLIELIMANNRRQKLLLEVICKTNGTLVPDDRKKKQQLIESYTGNQNEHYTGIKAFLKNLTISDLFGITLGLCAIGLVLIPELIYVRDIYTGDYKRANTMFKLTYQAFILFGTCSGFIFSKFLHKPIFTWQKKFTIVTLVLFLCTLWYSEVSIKAWYGNVFDKEKYKGLDAIAFMEESMPDDYEAVKWLNENVTGTPVVLEANGDSYSDNERISMATGLPTVLGWYVHEWLWRGDTSILEERIADIKTLYTTVDINEAKQIIDKYNIEYIYVGELEKEKFPEMNPEIIKNLGELVMEWPERDDKLYESFLVKVSD